MLCNFIIIYLLSRVGMNIITKLLVFSVLMMVVVCVDSCDDKAQINCLDDLQRAYPVCKKAA